MTNELKPCPFCGAKVEVFSDDTMTRGLVRHKDGCLFPNFRNHEIPECEFDAWNTRAERTCHVETVPLGIHDDTTADVCSECRVPLDGDEYYCPQCGARVVE